MKASLFSNKWFYIIALLIVVAVVYSPGLSGNFLFDDMPNIVENPTLRLFDGSFSSLTSAAKDGAAGPLGRPLSMASFALNLHFFGNGPFSFKLVNLLIHLANGVLIFILARQLWPKLNSGDKSPVAAFWIASVWLLHPINVTPVLLVVQRMTSLASFFMLAALCLYFHGRQIAGKKGWIAIAASLLVCWPAAIFSKESALLLPLFILVSEWLVLDGFRSIPGRVCWLGAFVLGLALVGIWALAWDTVAGGYRFRDFGLAERLMTEFRVLWFYLLQLTLPWPDFFSLHHDDIPISRGLLHPPETLLAIVAWIALTAFVIFRRKRAPLPAFALLWFLAAHVLESTVLPLEIAYEHRNYLASLGILIWCASLLFGPHEPEEKHLRKWAWAAGFVIFCGFTTTLRAAQWGDEFRRTLTEAAAHPDSARANNEAGLAVMERMLLNPDGRNALTYQIAQSYFRRAAELDVKAKEPFIDLLYLDCMANRPKDLGLQIELRKRFSTMPFPPGDSLTIQNLSQLLVENRLCLDDDEVKQLLDAALSNPAANGSIRGMLYTVGMDHAAAKMHSLNLALTYAQAAVRSNPGSIPLRINLVYVLLASGDQTASRKEYTVLARMPIAARDKAGFEQLSQKFITMEQNADKR